MLSLVIAAEPGVDAAFPAAAARRWRLTGACLLGVQAPPVDGHEMTIGLLVHLVAATSASPSRRE